MRSLQARLSVGLLVSLVLALILQWFVANRALEYLLKNYAVARLAQDTELLLAGLRKDQQGAVFIDPARIDPKYARPLSGDYYRIQTGARVVRSRSLWDTDLAAPALAPGTTDSREIVGPARQRLLLVTRGFHKFEQDIVIAVAADITPLQNDLSAFRWQYGMLSVAILVVLIALHAWWVRRGLKPLGGIRAELEALEQGDVQQLEVANAPREVQPLVQQINRLLGILTKRLERSRNATGNLAHALKTPLTALVHQIERPDTVTPEELRRQLMRHAQTVRELIERELKRARVAGMVLPARRYDLTEELNNLVQTLRMVYREKALEITVRATPATDCPLDREDLLELLGNLLDNACKWARSNVLLSVDGGAQWSFRVEDDGPGVTATESEKISGRGVRIDEGAVGHGLGLAIARDLVEQYRGTLQFDTSPSLGGFRAVAMIPRRGTAV